MQTINNLLKTISSRQHLTLTITYYSRPVANYAAPNFHNTNGEKIQRAQNSSLGIITRCHSISRVDHLHYLYIRLVPTQQLQSQNRHHQRLPRVWLHSTLHLFTVIGVDYLTVAITKEVRHNAFYIVDT